MKNSLLILLIAFSFFSCKKTEKNEIEKKETHLKIDKYVSLEYGSFDHNGEMIYYVSPFVVENSDSIGKTIHEHSRRISYLLTNKINLDTLNKLLPDSISINKVFKNEIANQKFVDYFKKTVLPNNQSKEKFTENEMMMIASKFFLAEQLPENKYGTRICSGVNGIDDKSNRDYTLLESVIFDAIFTRIMEQEKPTAKFMDNLSEYQTFAIKETENQNSENRLSEIRTSIFSSMENDKELKEYLLTYCSTNKNNIPIEITVANTVYN